MISQFHDAILESHLKCDRHPHLKADNVGHVRWRWRQESSGRFVRATLNRTESDWGLHPLAKKNDPVHPCFEARPTFKK